MSGVWFGIITLISLLLGFSTPGLNIVTLAEEFSRKHKNTFIHKNKIMSDGLSRRAKIISLDKLKLSGLSQEAENVDPFPDQWR